MTDRLPEKPGKGLGKVLKVLLLSFVFAAVYKIAAVPDKTIVVPVKAAAAAAGQAGPEAKPGAPSRALAAKGPVNSVAASRTAVVYYFYTNTRCASCKAIEAYTREAVQNNFTVGYKGWKVGFEGINVDEEPGKHFVQAYQLNAKSVVVQKFSGEKALKWKKLEKIWQLLGDKEVFMTYIADETRRLLDEK